jgi:hypothetical protein
MEFQPSALTTHYSIISCRIEEDAMTDNISTNTEDNNDIRETAQKYFSLCSGYIIIILGILGLAMTALDIFRKI